MKRIDIINQLYQLLDDTVSRTLKEESSFGQKLTLTNDPYASGKFALALSLLIEKDPERLHEWSAVWPVLAAAPCDNWGKYYFLQALLKLDKQDVLKSIFTSQQLQVLHEKLNWQEMIDETTGFLNSRFPTNFYGVAFSVARLRFLLGWDNEQVSQSILQQLLEHYRTHAENGCSDETNGNGRFDRYSVLLVAEICQRHIETGLDVPDWLKASLRQAVTLVLSILSEDGSGFQWGRSIGAYGDSAFNEILSVSMQLGLLNAQECVVANDFSLACSKRFLNFWYDKEELSVNLWFKGRQTDAYRAEHRLVGENISLCFQHINVQLAWNAISVPSATLIAHSQLDLKFTTFRQDEYIRGLFHWRDNQHVFVLPLINGDQNYHATSPYFPIPFSSGVLTGIAQGNAPLWVPGIRTLDGRVLRPLVWFSHCQYQKIQNGWEIVIQNDALDVVEENGIVTTQPQCDADFQCRTRYLIKAGSITREDTFNFPEDKASRLEVMTAVYSQKVDVRLRGYEHIHYDMSDLCSSTGPLEKVVTGWSHLSNRQTITVSWQVRY